ncbi:MAG: hypothetical protein ABW036_02330 [Flavitalea sp.]
MTDLSLTYKQLNFFEKTYQVALVLLLVISSGFPLFVNNKAVDLSVFLFIVAGAVYYNPKLTWVFKFTLGFAGLMLIQALMFGEFYIQTSIYQIILFSGAALAVALLGTNLLYIYTRIMLVIAVIGVVLFIPVYISPMFVNQYIDYSPFHVFKNIPHEGWTSTWHNFFLIHFPQDFFYGFIRNSGPFWEPGAFGGFLILALIFNSLVHNTLRRKENIVFTIAIISTFSTTTYIAAIFYVAGFLFMQMENVKLKWGLLAGAVVLGVVMFFKVDFVGDKIQKEIKEAEYQAFVKCGDTRMASAYLDLEEIKDNPMHIIFGRGSHPETRIKGPDKEVLRTNGVTDLLSRFGLLFYIFAVGSIYLSFRFITGLGDGKKGLALVALGTFFLLAFSELYFIYILFKTLLVFYMAHGERSGIATFNKVFSFKKKLLMDPLVPVTVATTPQNK